MLGQRLKKAVKIAKRRDAIWWRIGARHNECLGTYRKNNKPRCRCFRCGWRHDGMIKKRDLGNKLYAD